MESTPRTFRSKTDAWLVAVLIASASALIVVGALTMVALSGRSRWVLAASLFVGAVCHVWVLRSTRYVLGDQDLRVFSGPFRRVIPIHQIRSVTPTRSARASPALSLDRLRIDYDDRAVMISPVPKSEFIAALAERRAVVGSEDSR